MSLLQFDSGIMPFTFADVLLLRYLKEDAKVSRTVEDFNAINEASDLNWSLRSQMEKFIRRFWKEPYKDEDKQWMQKLVEDNDIKVKSKFLALRRLI